MHFDKAQSGFGSLPATTQGRDNTRPARIIILAVFFVASAVTKRKKLPPSRHTGTHASSDSARSRQFTGISGLVSRIDRDLECVSREDHGGMVTIQLALRDKLCVPMTVDAEGFYDWPTEEEQIAFLKRQAQGLLDIFGDARDGRVLSDQEVMQRANGVCM